MYVLTDYLRDSRLLSKIMDLPHFILFYKLNIIGAISTVGDSLTEILRIFDKESCGAGKILHTSFLTMTSAITASLKGQTASTVSSSIRLLCINAVPVCRIEVLNY